MTTTSTTVATTTTLALANAHAYFAALAQNDIAAAEARGSIDRQALDDFDRHSAACADYAARLTREQQRATLALLRTSPDARALSRDAIRVAGLLPCEVRTFGEGWREDGSVDLRDDQPHHVTVVTPAVADALLSAARRLRGQAAI